MHDRICRQGWRWPPAVMLLAAALIAGLLAGCARPTGVETLPPLADPAPTSAPSADATLDPFTAQRLELVERTMRRRNIDDPDVLRAMETVPRHRFVLPEYLEQAYADHPLPIGFGQTISQPYIVALMTELLQLEPGAKVLEIGAGSGYQAAVLAELVGEVYTIEIIPELAERAQAILASLGYDEVHLRQGDGYYGWPEEAPFDAIIVTAAPDHVPQPLVQQLKEGGRLVTPVGPPGGYQSLWQITRRGGELEAVNIAGVSFVPLVGGGQSGAQPGVPEHRFLDLPDPSTP